MKIGVAPLFTLRVTHEFVSGTYPDFEFVVSSAAARVLRGERLMTRVSPGVLQVFYEIGQGEPLPMTSGRILRVGLRPTDPYFCNYTALSSAFAVGVGYTRNAVGATALDPVEGRRLVGTRVTHSLSLSDRPVRVNLKDAEGACLRSRAITHEQSATEVSFDLSDIEPGIFSIEEEYEGGERRTTRYIADAELVRCGALVVVDVELHGAFRSAGADPEFQIAFEARKDPLNYYLVVDKYSAAEFDSLSVADRGNIEEGRTEIEFSRVSDSEFGAEEIPRTLLGSQASQVVLFRSRVPVARRRRALKKIQLSRNGDVLIESLPQPGPEKTDAILIIHISR